jgi:hypothetical protein
MKKIIIFHILFFLCLYASAQSGYQGKKFIVQYSSLIGFRASNPSFSQSSENMGINYTHSLEIDYTISRKHTIGLAFSNFRTSVADEFETTNTSKRLPSALKLTAYGAEFNVKFTNKNPGFIAPMGMYQKIGVGIWLGQLTDDSGTLKMDSIPVKQFTDFALSYGLGKRKVYFDRLVLDMGVHFSLTSSYNKQSTESYEGGLIRTEGGESYTTNDSIEDFAGKRLFNHIWITFKVGVGLLL